MRPSAVRLIIAGAITAVLLGLLFFLLFRDSYPPAQAQPVQNTPATADIATTRSGQQLNFADVYLTGIVPELELLGRADVVFAAAPAFETAGLVQESSQTAVMKYGLRLCGQTLRQADTTSTLQALEGILPMLAARKSDPEFIALWIQALALQGSTLACAGKLQVAKPILEQAIAAQRALHSERSAFDLAAYLMQLADCHARLGQKRRALELVAEAQAMLPRDEYSVIPAWARADLLLNKANTLMQLGDCRAAAAAASDATSVVVEIRKTFPFYPDLYELEINCQTTLSSAKLVLGETTEALSLARTAVDQTEALLYHNDHDVRWGLSTIAACTMLVSALTKSGELDEAGKILEDVLAWLNAGDPTRIAYVPALAASANALLVAAEHAKAAGKESTAREYAERALALSILQPGGEPLPELQDIRLGLLLSLNRVSEARAVLQELRTLPDYQDDAHAVRELEARERGGD